MGFLKWFQKPYSCPLAPFYPPQYFGGFIRLRLQNFGGTSAPSDYSDYQNNAPLIDALNEVRSRGVFLSNKIIHTAVFSGKQPQSVFARHTATPHPAEGQIVTGNSAVVRSRCRFEATGRYAGSCLTKKYSLTAPDPQVINRNIFLIITISAFYPPKICGGLVRQWPLVD
jgi:hypothetical protein